MKYNFSCDKLFHFYPEARVPPNSELSGLLEQGDLRAPVTQDIYTVDTTIKRKLSPSAIHFLAASTLTRRYKNCIAALREVAPVRYNKMSDQN